MLRLVGVADIQGDVLLPHRRHRAFVEHLCADIAELAELGVGDALDGLGVLDDLGVRHQEAGHIRPVLVHVGVQRRRGQCAGDVAAAAGKRVDAAVGHGPVESRNDHPPARRGTAQVLIAGLLVYRAVQLELQPQGAVQKIKAQIVRHQLRREVLAAGYQLIGADALVHLLPQGGKLRLQRGLQPQRVADGHIAGADHVIDTVAADAVLQVCVAQIQQVRDLVVVLVPLTGGTDHHHAAAVVSPHNVPYLGELFFVRHGRAAEFQYFQHIFASYFRNFCSGTFIMATNCSHLSTR